MLKWAVHSRPDFLTFEDKRPARLQGMSEEPGPLNFTGIVHCFEVEFRSTALRGAEMPIVHLDGKSYPTREFIRVFVPCPIIARSDNSKRKQLENCTFFTALSCGFGSLIGNGNKTIPFRVIGQINPVRSNIWFNNRRRGVRKVSAIQPAQFILSCFFFRSPRIVN